MACTDIDLARDCHLRATPYTPLHLLFSLRTLVMFFDKSVKMYDSSDMLMKANFVLERGNFPVISKE